MTPLQLTSLSGILRNQGIEPNANGILSITRYEAIPAVSNLVLAISRAQALRYDPANVSNSAVANLRTSVSNAAIQNITTIGSSTVPALGDSVPTTTQSANIGNIILSNLYPGLSGYATYQAFQIATPTDLGKFCQKFTTAVSYVKQTNDIILTSKNTNFLGPTFGGMDNLTTGGFNGVNTDLSNFGKDLARLGDLINYAALGEMGSPVGLFRQLVTVGGLLPGLIGAIEGVNAEQTATGAVVISIDQLNGLTLPGSELTDSVQILLYKAMQRVTGNTLDEVLSVLNVTTANIATMADLLNPVKIFPTSYATMLAPIPAVTGAPLSTTTGGLPPNRARIYTSGTAVNTTLATLLPSYLIRASESSAQQITYERLRTIIPADQALANKALEASLEQIKNINQQTSAQLATTVSSMELNSGLPLIQNMTQPVPTAVVDSLSNTIPKGSGPNGTLTLFDVLGVVSGSTQANLEAVTGNITAINTTALNDVYNVMAKMLNGDYNVYANGLTGTVTSVTVNSSGSGYTYVPTLLFSGGNPTAPAVATVNMSGNLSNGTGTVSSVTIVTGGSNYQSVPTVKPSGGSATFTASLLGNSWVAINTPYGNYAPNYSNALSNLCNVANTTIVSIRTSNAARVANINANWSVFANSLAYQANSLQKAGITEGNVSTAQTPVVMSFVESLHEYGLDTAPGGAVEYLTLVTEPNTLTGQAIRATLREGRNLKLLQDSGIGTDSSIPK